MEKLLVIVGPTAVGKSAVALQVAKKFAGEIISADSVQVYRGLNIGAAKPTMAERNTITHHLLDIVNPQDNYTVADFQKDATDAIADVHKRHKLPILTGGTGLYIRAVIQGYAFSETGKNEMLRIALQREADELGPEALHNRLAVVDPQAAARLHPNDLRRVIRALEVYDESQRSISQQEELTTRKSPYQTLIFGLTMPRAILYALIEKRVEQMMVNGLLEEVQDLMQRGVPPDAKSMQSLGYKQLVAYLAGKMSLEDAVTLIKRDTRRFAKRQLTWFRREQGIRWLDIHELGGVDQVAENISNFLEGYSLEKENT